MWCRIKLTECGLTILDAEGDVEIFLTASQAPAGERRPTGKRIVFKGEDICENRVEAEITVKGIGA
jgi:hypothetical protein